MGNHWLMVVQIRHAQDRCLRAKVTPWSLYALGIKNLVIGYRPVESSVFFVSGRDVKRELISSLFPTRRRR